MGENSKKTESSEVFDFTIYKMNRILLDLKRDPKTSQQEVMTLEAIIALYNEKKIVISWHEGEPYMHVNPESDFNEEDINAMFKKSEVWSQ